MSNTETISTPRFDVNKAKLRNIKIVSFNTNDNNGETKRSEIESFNSQFSFTSRFMLEHKIVRLETSLTFTAFQENRKISDVGGRLIVLFEYQVDNISDFIQGDIKPEGTKMDAILATNLLGIAYSTLRGIFYVKAQDTILENLMLPIVNPLDLIQSQAI